MLQEKPSMETKLTIAGLIMSLFIGVVVLLVFMGEATVTPRTWMYLAMVLVVFLAVLAILVYANRNAEKTKHEFDGVNIYRFMDTMLDTLSPDELNYLKRLVNDTKMERDWKS